MFTVYSSQLQSIETFEDEVKKYIARMKAANFDKNKPRPTAHPLIEASVKRVNQGKGKPDDFQADYQIVDDVSDPTVGMPHDQKLDVCASRLHLAEAAAKDKVLNRHKLRLFGMQYTAAISVKDDNKSQADKDIITQFAAIQEAYKKIELTAAEEEARLADMNDVELSAWKPPTF